MDCFRSSRRARRGETGALLPSLLGVCLLCAFPALAQEAGEDVFGGLGTTTTVEAGAAEGDAGTLLGRVIDGESGSPVPGTTVIVVWPPPEDGSAARQEVQTTGPDGGFEFPTVPPGRYTVTFVKAGYRTSSMTNVEVLAGELHRADFPLPRLPTDTESGQVLELEAFVVEASTVNDMLAAIELRVESDQLLNIMTAEDLSKFASSDVADALKRVAGINIVEGQFAIIRGLEDRYSSTLFNAAPIPSPDPNRQSVQLDLFPSEVVTSLVVAKNFAPDLPGNSAAGSVDIVTSGYPETEGAFDVKVYAKTGVNQNAWDDFLQYQSGSPMGNPTSGSDVLEQEYGGFVGGHAKLFGRGVRYKLIANWETRYETAQGFQEGRAPSAYDRGAFHNPLGDLAFGELNLTSGRFDLTDSLYEKQLTTYGGFGFDLDEAGHHKIDAAIFWTHKDEKEVELRENGYLPGFDYGRLIGILEDPFEEIDANEFYGNSGSRPGKNAAFDAWIVSGIGPRARPLAGDPATQGAAWFSSFAQSRSFSNRRDLQVYQVNGDHDLVSLLEGLQLRWAGNYATTSQDEQALGARYRYEPCGLDPQLPCPEGVTPFQTGSDLPTAFPIRVEALGPGDYLVNRAGLFSSSDQIDEKQYFGRLDGSYETDPLAWLHAELETGFWYEHAKRGVDADFLFANDINLGNRCNSTEACFGNGSQFVFVGDTPQELGKSIFSKGVLDDGDGGLLGLRAATSDATREIGAWNFGAKTTLKDRVDVLGGLRVEKIRIESRNDPFVAGNENDGTPKIFPSKYLLFDRQDNRRRGEAPQNPPFNDQILGIDVPVGPCRDRQGNVIPNGGECVDLIDQAAIEEFVNGKIDELKVLPSVGLAYRPYDWLTLRAAWSQTVARPSFREIGYYVSVEPGTDELFIGNPQLQLSDVESWDARAEVVWGEAGDLFALSGFYKTVQDPIEQIILRDPSVRDTGSPAVFRTFFNNPNEATLWGIELEGRKNLGFLGREFFEYLSVGGNFTWIEAEVGRSEFELARSQRFFGNTAGQEVTFSQLKTSRRLYNQPQWIVNADISFDQPSWGTKATFAVFAISDVLDAAGGATDFELTSGSPPFAYTLDRYVDSFYQLDFVLSQDVWQGVALKLTAKNLTDSLRGIVYDPSQTSQTFAERRYREGRDFSLALSWSFSGPDL